MFAAGYTIKPSGPGISQPSFADRFMENLQPKSPSAFEAAPSPQVSAPLRPTPSRAPTTLAPAAGAMQLVLFAYALPLALAEAHPEWVEQSRVAHQDPKWRVHNAYAYGWETSLRHMREAQESRVQTNADRHQAELDAAWQRTQEMIEAFANQQQFNEDPFAYFQRLQQQTLQAAMAVKSAQAAAGLSGGALGVKMSAAGGNAGGAGKVGKASEGDDLWNENARAYVYHQLFSPSSPVEALDVLSSVNVNDRGIEELAEFLLGALIELGIPINERLSGNNRFFLFDAKRGMMVNPLALLTPQNSLRDIIFNISQAEWDQLPGTQVWANGPSLNIDPAAIQASIDQGLLDLSSDEDDDFDDGNCMMLEISSEAFAEARRRFELEQKKGGASNSEVLRRTVEYIDSSLGAMRPTAHPPMMLLRGYIVVLNQEQARELNNFLFKAAGEVSVHISQPTRVIDLADPGHIFDPTKDLSFYLSSITWREWARLRESPSWRKMLGAVPQAVATTMPEQTAPVVHHDATSTMLVDLPAQTLSTQVQQLLAARTQREATHILMEANLPDALRLAQIIARAAIHSRVAPPGWWLAQLSTRLTVFEERMGERSTAEVSEQQEARRIFATLINGLMDGQWYDLRNEPGLKAFGEKLLNTPADQVDKAASDYYDPQPSAWEKARKRAWIWWRTH